MSEPDESAVAAAPAARYTVRRCDSADGLDALAEAFESLAGNALEPSPAAERWMLAPALRHLAAAGRVTVALVYVDAAGAPPYLAGVFPFELKPRYRGLPGRVLSLWHHEYAPLAAPLVDRRHAAGCLRAVLDWVAEAWPAPALVEFPALPTETAFFGVLVQFLRASGTEHALVDWWTRPLFRPAADADRFVARALSGRTRKHFASYGRRLAERGDLAYAEWTRATPLEPWIDEFVALELAGWKGREGTAFGSSPGHRAFFAATVAGAAERDRLLMVALRLDGRALAMQVNLLGAPGAWGFKTAFDEGFAAQSPGLLLQVECTRRLHAHPEIRWMDSLAPPEDATLARIWPDRATVVTLLVAPPRRYARLLVGLFPALRLAVRAFRWKSGHA